jgi:carbonic anhydrase/acetyltransferase-like protein (isoleucine patch superfamily)
MAVRPYRGQFPAVASSAYVDDAALVIGRVTIAEDSSIWPMTVARGDVNDIEIGRATNIQDGCVLHVSHDSEFEPGGHPLRIGDHVTVGHRAVLHACTVGDFCLVGIGSVVLDGAILQPRVLLGAGSVVTPGKVLEGGCLWLGSPARRVRPLREEELRFLEYSAVHYVQLKNEHQRERGR